MLGCVRVTESTILGLTARQTTMEEVGVFNCFQFCKGLTYFALSVSIKGTMGCCLATQEGLMIQINFLLLLWNHHSSWGSCSWFLYSTLTHKLHSYTPITE